MERIQMTCQTCNHVYDLRKTSEIPANVFFMKCNWCPKCEDKADSDYEEWYDKDENKSGEPPSPPVPDNQLCFPFIMDEIGVPKSSLQST